MDTELVVSLVAASSSILSAMFAAGSAYFAAKAAREARNAVVEQIYSSLTDLYADPKMLEAMVRLRRWKEGDPPGFPYDPNGDFHPDRRMVKFYFLRLFRLRERGLISDEDEVVLMHERQLSFLLEVIRPSEEQYIEAIDGKLVDAPMYQHYEELQARLNSGN